MQLLNAQPWAHCEGRVVDILARIKGLKQGEGGSKNELNKGALTKNEKIVLYKT